MCTSSSPTVTGHVPLFQPPEHTSPWVPTAALAVRLTQHCFVQSSTASSAASGASPSSDTAAAESTHQQHQALGASEPLDEGAADFAEKEHQDVRPSLPLEESAAESAPEQHQRTAGELAEVAGDISRGPPALDRLSSKRQADRAWSDSTTPSKRQELDQPATSASPAAAGDTDDSDTLMTHALASDAAAATDDKQQLPLKRQELDQPSTSAAPAAAGDTDDRDTAMTEAVPADTASAADGREQSVLKRQKLSTSPSSPAADDRIGSGAADTDRGPTGTALPEDTSAVDPDVNMPHAGESDGGRTAGSSPPAHDISSPTSSLESSATGDRASGSSETSTVAGPISPVSGTQLRMAALGNEQDDSQASHGDGTAAGAGNVASGGTDANTAAQSQTTSAPDPEAGNDVESEAGSDPNARNNTDFHEGNATGTVMSLSRYCNHSSCTALFVDSRTEQNVLHWHCV